MAAAESLTPKTEAAISKKRKTKSSGCNWPLLAVTLCVGSLMWLIPVPAELVNFCSDVKGFEGIAPEVIAANCWHLLAIFVATIVGLILKPIPMGSMCILQLTVIMLCKLLDNGTSSGYITNALSGFHNTTIWLIVIAFFISRGFIKTGLGSRIAYAFMSKFGKKTLGLTYSLIFTDLVLSTAMPSNTARAGGVIFPIVQALSNVFGSKPDDGTERKIGSYLHITAFQADMITSGMFLTAMAANPLSVTLAASLCGIDIDWLGWAIAAFIPGMVCLIVVPIVIFIIFPPEIKETPEATSLAKQRLAEMGPMKTCEKLMIGVFIVILFLWIMGTTLGINATVTAFIGLTLLILTNVLTWDDIKNEKGAWDTLVWFSVLVMMATYLNTLGLIPWFSNLMAGAVGGLPWVAALVILGVVYFLSHYLFASATAHVSAMYSAFLAVCIAAGAPPLASAMLLGVFSNLMGCLTHYGSGPAPVYFGAGYVTQGKWWSIGLLCGIITMVIFFTIGFAWWGIIGYL